MGVKLRSEPQPNLEFRNQTNKEQRVPPVFTVKAGFAPDTRGNVSPATDIRGVSFRRFFFPSGFIL